MSFFYLYYTLLIGESGKKVLFCGKILAHLIFQIFSTDLTHHMHINDHIFCHPKLKV